MNELSKQMMCAVLEASETAGLEYADDRELDMLLACNTGKGRNLVASDSDSSVSLYSEINAIYRSYHRKG